VESTHSRRSSTNPIATDIMNASLNPCIAIQKQHESALWLCVKVIHGRDGHKQTDLKETKEQLTG